MGEIISTFNLDWRMITAQLVNFAIVVLVLWFFAFKPLSKKMDERTKKIEKGLKDAEEIEQKLQAVNEEKEKQFARARKEAEGIINQARDLAEQQKEQIAQKAKEEVAKTVALAKKQIAAEKENMLAEIKSDTVELVVAASAKILEKMADKKIDRELVKNTLGEMTKK